MNTLPRHGPAALETRLAWARSQDAADALAGLRARFALPRAADGSTLLYFCGHSLGLAPTAARAMIGAEIADWERLGVLGHEYAGAPWTGYAERLAPLLAPLAGALPHEVVAMNSLSVNLHLLLASFYRPSGGRRAILIEAGAFSSDRHVVASQIGWHGLDPEHELIELAPRPGEDLIRIEDVEERIATDGARIALVLWPGLQYRTGQLFDLQRIARAAHAAGCMVGFDLAHAVGNLPLQLHDSGADFAIWCSYKYLNGGPGAVGGAFVHERHARTELPRFAGWWGHDKTTRFQMGPQFVPTYGADGWQLSNPPILALTPLRVSLEIFRRAGMSRLREKSLRLTGYLEWLVQTQLGQVLEVVTPVDPARRGAQLSIRVLGGREQGRALFAYLMEHGIIGDWREPDVIRISPAPLYNQFTDCLAFADAVKAWANLGA
jgi:kynureninase